MFLTALASIGATGGITGSCMDPSLPTPAAAGPYWRSWRIRCPGWPAQLASRRAVALVPLGRPSWARRHSVADDGWHPYWTITTPIGGSRVPTWFARVRPWLALAGVAAILGALLPPVASFARHDDFAESLQFVIFATAGPALLVLGAPWRVLRLSRRPEPGLARQQPPAGLADRIARSRSRRPGVVRASAVLVTFIAAAIGWRLPVTVTALAREPGLAAGRGPGPGGGGDGDAGGRRIGSLAGTGGVPAAAAPAAATAAGRRCGAVDVEHLGAGLPHGPVPRGVVCRVQPRARPRPQHGSRPADRRRRHVGGPGTLLRARHLCRPDYLAARQRGSGRGTAPGQ